MPYTVTLKPGLVNVVLPNGDMHQGGDVVVLTDEQYERLSPTAGAALFSSVTPGGDGGGVVSVNGKDGVVVLTATDVSAAAATHVHSAADITTGTLAAARIASLPASQIGSGTLAAARLPKGAAVADLAVDADLPTTVAKTNALLASLRVNHITP